MKVISHNMKTTFSILLIVLFTGFTCRSVEYRYDHRGRTGCERCCRAECSCHCDQYRHKRGEDRDNRFRRPIRSAIARNGRLQRLREGKRVSGSEHHGRSSRRRRSSTRGRDGRSSGVSAVVQVADQTTVDTETSTLGDTVTTARIQDNPVNGRDFTQLLATVPGSVQTTNQFQTSINGIPSTFGGTSVLVDGIDARPRRREWNIQRSGTCRVACQPRQHGQHSGDSGSRAELFGTVRRRSGNRHKPDHKVGHK